jgi:Leucine-rich repeat (LRR) protein
MTSVSVGCYANCKELESIEIPESIITIGDQAFSACRNAKGTIKVPANIQKIGHNAFANCDNITSFELICNGNPELQTYICYNNISLTEIKISDHLTLPSRMFAYCSGLEEINLNNNLADQVFSNCTGLKKVISGSKHFGQQAFSGCSNLETVILTNKELTFDSYVFDACPKLETFGPLADAKGNMENLKYDFNYA